jgi:hypothetical protein
VTDEPTSGFPDREHDLHTAGSSRDSLSARTLTVTLAVALGVLVVLVILLIR